MSFGKVQLLRALTLLSIAAVAVYEAADSPHLLSRVSAFLPALAALAVVLMVFEGRSRLRPYRGFAWVAIFNIFLIGLSIGESSADLLASLLLGAVIATSRTFVTGGLVGALAATAIVFLSTGRSDDGLGSLLPMAPLFLLTGLLAGVLSRELERAREDGDDLIEQLAEQTEQISNMLACVASGVLVVDGDRRVQTYNRAAERILGVEEHKALGRELSSVPHLAQLEEAFSEAAPSSELGTVEAGRHDIRFSHPDGRTIHVGYAVSPLENRAGLRMGTVLVFQDVTLIRDYADRMLRQEKLASLGRMVSGIAHEFGNILGGARGLLDLAMTEEPAEAVESLPVIRETLARALETVDNLLRFARGTPLNRAPGVDLGLVLERSLNLLRVDLEAGQVVVETRFESVGPVVADAVQLEQVFINFIINAIHAVDGREDRRLRVSLDCEGEKLRVRFEDTGPGVSDEVRDRIFEPFFTTKGALGGSQVPGTGLGLSVALGVVESHEGSVTVSASPDLAGACFTISLPSTNGEGASKS